MENRKRENCSFSSYINDDRAQVGAHGGSGSGHTHGGSTHGSAAFGGESSGGIFKRVRMQRAEGLREQGMRTGGSASPFNSGSTGRAAFTSREHTARRGGEPSAAAQAAKFAVLLACVCAFSLLFALKLTRAEPGGEALAVFRSAMNGGTEEEDEERLGRLKLIRLPGLLSVFAPSDVPIAPLFAEQAVTDDSYTARLFSARGTQVLSMLSGTVRSVDPAAEHGGSVTIACKNGVEITYMGLSEILVERGQPVLQRTVLGTLSGEVLYLRVSRDGRPVDPLEFLGTAARVG